jgi:hypothetical protein
VQQAEHVDVDHVPPLVEPSGVQTRERHDARVRDEHVEPAVLSHDGVDHVTVDVRARDVEVDGLRGPARCRDALDQLVEPLTTPRADDHVVPVRGEPLSRGGADPAARAGDEDDLLFGVCVHVFHDRPSSRGQEGRAPPGCDAPTR